MFALECLHLIAQMIINYLKTTSRDEKMLLNAIP